MDAEKRTQSRTERESGLPQGYMVRLLGTSSIAKQIFSPGPDVIRKLADYLRISYEWLAVGRGPMRGSEFGFSSLESATRFALAHGARQDAIDAAAARFRDVANMTGNDWVLAFNAEATRLERAGIPRPEIAEAKRRRIRSLSKEDAGLVRKNDAVAGELVSLEEKKLARERGELPPAPKRGRRRPVGRAR